MRRVFSKQFVQLFLLRCRRLPFLRIGILVPFALAMGLFIVLFARESVTNQPQYFTRKTREVKLRHTKNGKIGMVNVKNSSGIEIFWITPIGVKPVSDKEAHIVLPLFADKECNRRSTHNTRIILRPGTTKLLPYLPEQTRFVKLLVEDDKGQGFVWEGTQENSIADISSNIITIYLDDTSRLSPASPELVGLARKYKAPLSVRWRQFLRHVFRKKVSPKIDLDIKIEPPLKGMPDAYRQLSIQIANVGNAPIRFTETGVLNTSRPTVFFPSEKWFKLTSKPGSTLYPLAPGFTNNVELGSSHNWKSRMYFYLDPTPLTVSTGVHFTFCLSESVLPDDEVCWESEDISLQLR